MLFLINNMLCITIKLPIINNCLFALKLRFKMETIPHVYKYDAITLPVSCDKNMLSLQFVLT